MCANTGTTGVSTITAGLESVYIAFSVASVDSVIGLVPTPRTFALYNVVPGADVITLAGFALNIAANALATQMVSNGLTMLTLGDSTTIYLGRGHLSRSGPIWLTRTGV